MRIVVKDTGLCIKTWHVAQTSKSLQHLTTTFQHRYHVHAANAVFCVRAAQTISSLSDETVNIKESSVKINFVCFNLQLVNEKYIFNFPISLSSNQQSKCVVQGHCSC